MLDHKLFKNPPKEFGELPFWGWNDELKLEELRRQIALIDEAGWSGFLVNARVGLRTPYLGPEWMSLVKECAAEARARGLSLWIYDEDQWPSGFAGGLNVAERPEYRARYLVCVVDNRPAYIAERIATFKAIELDGRLTEIQPEKTPQLDKASDRIIQFYPQRMPLGSKWFRDYAYIDVLNPDAVRAFIDTTYEIYADAVGGDFGGAIPGIFTVEPSFMSGYDIICGNPGIQQPAIPWTDSFPDFFREKSGYDLLDYLPSLFFDVGDFQRIRFDYWRSITELFTESYTQQAYEWCDSHNLQFTGHYMAEDTLYSQIRYSGAMMPHYARKHIPGVDKLGREINVGYGTVLSLKQMDSVISQMGKSRGLCWAVGTNGSDFALKGRKWIGDWAYVMGANLHAPSLSLYGMRGENKRDYPPNSFYQQPWWSEMRIFSDYISRLSYVLSKGQRVVDILVIHPIGSAWSLFRPDGSYAVDQLDRSLHNLLMQLMANQRDFHLGDEFMMLPEGHTEANVVSTDNGAQLEVGLMRYQTVIIPPGTTLTSNTVRLLADFAESGGSIIAMEPVPSRIDARTTKDQVLPGTTIIALTETIASTLDELLPFDIRIKERPTIWAHHRQMEDVHCYFIAETSQENEGPANVLIRGSGHIEEWDPISGDTIPVAYQQENGISKVNLEFAPMSSHLLLRYPTRETHNIVPSSDTKLDELLLGSTWELATDDPNAITLDIAQVCIGDNSDWTSPMDILDAHALVADAGTETPFAIRFNVNASEIPEAPVYLIVENPEQFSIDINGSSIPVIDEGWWRDIFFRKVLLQNALKVGQNEIVLRGVFTRATGLESVYLIGKFGVDCERLQRENRVGGQTFDRYSKKFKLSNIPSTIQSTDSDIDVLAIDLTAQGLPFFAGRATLRQEFELAQSAKRVILRIDDLHAAVAQIHINDQYMGTIGWPPYQVDISDGVRVGTNTIVLELASTLRNLLGPHHLAGGDLEWTSPEEFRDKSRWIDEYTLVPFGFMGVKVILYD